MVLVMVVVGGLTRLTESGLSITEWKPITGIIPPLSEADWAHEFELYKQIPQYQIVNNGMSLDEFKFIFFWEWFHRFWGRLIGFAFAIPFVVFLVQRRFTWNLAAPLGVLFVLGGFLGFLGWWIVTSGLSELTSVSQYRLSAHLTAALLLFIALIWVSRRLTPGRTVADASERPAAIILLLLVILQIAAGGFVAGLDAGMGYNTWPLMDGALVPNGLGVMDPWWKNLFENALTVQFVHRTIAYVLALYAGALYLWRRGQDGWIARIALIVLLQVVLGIGTLLSFVSLPVALGHQALAFMLAGAIVAWLADMRTRSLA